jgi:DNA-binding beta-propeller fold protein YncE
MAFAFALPAAGADGATRDVLFVGNNWDGTADVVDPQKFTRLARINIVPDLDERVAEIQSDPAAYGYFLAIRQEVGEGHDQLVDDMFSSHDGRYLYVSRPSLVDVVAFDLATRKIVWRVKVDGNRADHMAISPDGTRLLVSASTSKVIDVIDPGQGKIVGRIPSGDQPHENNFSKDGKLIYHASIGTVYTPLDDPAFDATKGERVFEVIDANTLEVIKKIDMGQKLEEFGMPGMSSAVRPMALSPDERYVYFQLSFLHGFVEYDLQTDKVLRVAQLPLSEKASKLRRDEYLLDSAHHGLAMNPEGTKLCAAGTMSDYAAIVSRQTFAYRILPVGEKPYWATNSGDGKYCFVSASGIDSVAVIDYASEDMVARIPVGDHPQRMRMGRMTEEALAAPAPTPTTRSRVKGALKVAIKPKRIRAGRAATVKVVVTTLQEGAAVPVVGARVSLAGVRGKTNATGTAKLRLKRGVARKGRLRVRVSRAGYRVKLAAVRAR